jgi:hypothetical protein
MSYLFIKKYVSKRKICIIFIKNLKLKKNIFSGFFRCFFGFLSGFFLLPTLTFLVWSAVLQMGGNSISRLDGNSFRGMRFMRRLYFENNQISAIGRQTFQNLRQGDGAIFMIVLSCSVADPGSGAFLPPGSGSRIRMEKIWFRDSE